MAPDEKKQKKQSKTREVTPIDKAAIVLYSLGEAAASEVLKFLEHDDVRNISKSMTQMASVSSKIVQDTIDEFYNMVSNEEGTIVTISEDYVKNVIANVFGEKTAERMLESITLQEDSSYLEIFRSLDMRVLAEFVRNEHPQTIALIMSQLLPEESSLVLTSLPEHLQLEVLDRMANLENVSPEMLRDVAHVLESEDRLELATEKARSLASIS